MKKILRIESARPMDDETWTVGKTKRRLQDGEIVKITEIKDMSVEYPDGVERQYDIYAEGKLFKSIVNMPVIIDYEMDDTE